MSNTHFYVPVNVTMISDSTSSCFLSLYDRIYEHVSYKQRVINIYQRAVGLLFRCVELPKYWWCVGLCVVGFVCAHDHKCVKEIVVSYFRYPCMRSSWIFYIYTYTEIFHYFYYLTTFAEHIFSVISSIFHIDECSV